MSQAKPGGRTSCSTAAPWESRPDRQALARSHVIRPRKFRRPRIVRLDKMQGAVGGRGGSRSAGRLRANTCMVGLKRVLGSVVYD